MDSDDRLKQQEEERRRMLEAIRRRSEEAELKRLEDEEKKVSREPPPPPAAPVPVEPPTSFAPPPEPPVAPPLAPFAPPAPESVHEAPPSFAAPQEPSPFPVPESSGGQLSAEDQQRAVILREKFLIAVDRGKAGKAADILTELEEILPPDEIDSLRGRLHALEEQSPRGKGKKRKGEEPPLPPAPQEPQRPEVHRKKIAELLEGLNEAYQQEKYTAALGGIEQILRLDAQNEEALRLKEEILRAQQLAEQIALEDEKRRREEAAAMKALRRSESHSGKIAPGPGVPGGHGDIWGASAEHTPVTEAGIQIMPEEKGPVAPPKPPILDRVAARVVRVRMPVKPLLIALGAIVAIAAVYVIIDNIRNAVAPPLYSVLVVPPAVSAEDSSVFGLAEGLTIDLTQDLATVSDLRVVAPPTTYLLNGSSLGILQRCRAVSSNFYLRWSIGRQGESLLLQSDLYDTASSKPLWSSRKVSSLRDLALHKMEMARMLIVAMKIKTSDEEERLLNQIPTSNEYAYTSYLRARAMLRHPNFHSIQEVIQVLEQSIASDSLFGRAQSALGWAHLLAYEQGDRAPAHLAEARTRVQRSIALVLRNPEAHRVWGGLEFLQGNFDKAVERFEEAVEIAPSDVESQSRLAVAYAAKNDLQAAVKAASRAVMDDSWNVMPYMMLGQVQQFAAVLRGDEREDYLAALRVYERGIRFAPDKSEYGSTRLADILVVTQQPDRALALMEDRLARARESHDDLYILGRVQQSAGRPKQEWQETFRRALGLLKGIAAARPDDALAQSHIALVHTRLGEFRDAVAANQRALKISPSDPSVLYDTARMYAMQNDKQQAKEYLGKAVDRYFSLPDILDFDLFTLHREPEFARIVTR